MSLAIAKAVLDSKADRSDLSSLAVRYMRELGDEYPAAGYGGGFRRWLALGSPDCGLTHGGLYDGGEKQREYWI